MRRNLNAVKLMNAILAGERNTFQQSQRNIIRDVTRKTRYNTLKMDNKFAVLCDGSWSRLEQRAYKRFPIR